MDVEIQLGDRVLRKRLLCRNQTGTVVYIPGISPRHPDIEYETVRQWAIELDDGTILFYGYYPDLTQPKRNLSFLGRGSPRTLPPDIRLY